MGRKLNLTSLLFQTPTALKTTSSSFSSSSSSSSSSSPSSNSSWQLWPSCKNPRTNSFNAENNNNIYKTVNSIYLEYSSEDDISLPANDVEDNDNDNDNDSSPEKALVKGLIRSDRFFFEPGSNTTSSLVVEAIEEEEEEEEVDGHGHGDEKMEESVVMMAMESEDPYADFRRSMEEVVGAHDEAMSRDWGWLEELLVWYLRVNGKANHGFIVGAFVDLLLELAGSKVDKASDDSSASSSSDYGYASCRSNSMSCTVSCEIEEEEEEEEGGGGCC